MQYNLQYSQNFLRDPLLVRRLLKLSSINSNDTVIEIGPGRGIITQELAESCGHLIVVEKDETLEQELQTKFDAHSVTIWLGDFLDYPLPQSKYKIFANIPFIITAGILKTILNAANSPEETYLIIQQEPAKKYAGQPFGNETLASLIYKPWFEFRILYIFKREDFSPPPSVAAVLLQIKKRDPPLVEDAEKDRYKDFLAYIFLQKNPTLKQKCKRILTHEQFKRLAKDLGFNIHAKATDITLDQWLGLFNYFKAGVSPEKQNLINGSLNTLRLHESRLKKMHRSRPG